MQLSPHFSLAELTFSQEAARHGIDNMPDEVIKARLKLTADHMEGVRTLLKNGPILINSGYRSPALNARIPGSSPTSGHMMGYAVDFICPKFGAPLTICRAIRASNIEFDQIIWEYSWVHISFDPRMRGQTWTKLPGQAIREGLG